MADLIIKPSSGNSLVFQDEGGDAALTVGTTGTTTFAENATFSGTANNVGTVTAGTIDNAVIHRLGASNIKSSDGSTTAMTCTSAGVINFPNIMTNSARPAFSTYGTNYTSNDGSDYKVIAAGELFDNGNNYSSGTFTAPVDGMYEFGFWSLLYNVTEGNVGSAQYRVNGSNVAGASSIGSSQGIQSGMTAGNHYERTGIFLTELDANDYIELWASITPGQFYSGQCNMCGKLVG